MSHPTSDTVTATEAAEILNLGDSPDPAAAARRKLRRRGVEPIDPNAVPRRYLRAAVEREARTTPRKPGRPRTAPRGPFVTLSFTTDVRVDLGRLTPVARALAETMAAQPLTGTARAAIVLESRLPLREMTPPEEWEQYAPADLDRVHRQVWRGWAPWHSEREDIHAWLECEAAQLPAGYIPVRPHMREDWRAPSADAALAEDELLSRDRSIALLRHLGVRISLEGWRFAVRDGDAPQPVVFVEGGQPRWNRADVARYALQVEGAV